MKKLQPKIFIDTEVSLETGYNISTGYSIGQVIHFNDTGKEYYHCTNGTWKEYGSPAKDTYSYDEKIIGEWVDGKPIYRKVILLDNSYDYDGANIFVGHSILIDEYIDYRLIAPNGGHIYLLSSITADNLYFEFGIDIFPMNYHLILEYTKL